MFIYVNSPNENSTDWVFWPFVNHFFPRKILLALFLIKLLLEIDSYSKLKMNKPGHSCRWLIRKKKLFSLKNDAQPYQPLILAENEMWFPEVWLTFLEMMELISRLDFYWLSWLYCTGKTFQMWSWHQLKITPIYLSIHFELPVIYSHPSYLTNRISFFFSQKEYLYKTDYCLRLNTFYSLKVDGLDFRNVYFIDNLHIFHLQVWQVIYFNHGDSHR